MTVLLDHVFVLEKEQPMTVKLRLKRIVEKEKWKLLYVKTLKGVNSQTPAIQHTVFSEGNLAI